LHQGPKGGEGVEGGKLGTGKSPYPFRRRHTAVGREGKLSGQEGKELAKQKRQRKTRAWGSGGGRVSSLGVKMKNAKQKKNST